MNWVKFKAQTQLNKKCSAVKHTKIKGVPKLDDANDAGNVVLLCSTMGALIIWAHCSWLCALTGGKNSIGCTLILTEGDSAKTLAVSGLGVVGRDRYGVFPLRGKMLNVREASLKQVRPDNIVMNTFTNKWHFLYLHHVVLPIRLWRMLKSTISLRSLACSTKRTTVTRNPLRLCVMERSWSWPIRFDSSFSFQTGTDDFRFEIEGILLKVMTDYLIPMIATGSRWLPH